MTASDESGVRRTASDTATPALLRRLTLGNVACLYRYVALRARYRNLRVGLFSLQRGASVQIGPQARLRFGRSLRIARDFTGHFYGRVTIGDGVFFNRACYVSVRQELTIGDHCLFGEMVSIHDSLHATEYGGEPVAGRDGVQAPIVIGNNVWVGAKATILPGAQIGDNCVIGAGAVVSGPIPAYTIAAGLPARPVRAL